MPDENPAPPPTIALSRVEWIKQFLSKAKEYFVPAGGPVLFFDGTMIGLGMMIENLEVGIGIPPEMFEMSPEELAARLLLEYTIRKKVQETKLHVEHTPPTLAHVEWSCVRCGVTRLECKCSEGPLRSKE